MVRKGIQIAIDGPAGSGKSTVAKALAKRLGLLYIDTGAMYRALTYKILERGIDFGDKQCVIATAENTHIKLTGEKVFLDGRDVTLQIRSTDVDKNVSKIAQIPEVRHILVNLQRRMASEQGVVMDGRDIGTYVLPDAEYKFFLTASIEERARRRYNDLVKKSAPVHYNQVKEDLENRDKLDSSRQFSPLRMADDAILIDTTGKSVNQVLEEIMGIVGGKEDVL